MLTGRTENHLIASIQRDTSMPSADLSIYFDKSFCTGDCKKSLGWYLLLGTDKCKSEVPVILKAIIY